ncbi:glycoside hydrolase [Punctularia strigosozonata HHB-11173 SS5]|uniref:glycoside hydrolase n=1 Tax=Punctularia strigosozonata (strain HHB-11173) TaxID=741275 RepID=UPI0004416937|nr:glycoside hydrolase [Punctularia strigosozonata HHB-11173 SS5]EIN13700.1 glycoside hydrolase [Punctularia strigosozonata HHB-11173 SS5]
MSLEARTQELRLGWQWKERCTALTLFADINADHTSDSKYQWRYADSIPSEIHVELLKAGLIPDPYVGFNEHLVQWIGDTEWLYRFRFSVDVLGPEAEFVDLQLEGLDSICDIYVIKLDRYKLDAINELLLHFKSAKNIALDEEKKYGAVRAGSTNLGHPSRVYVRKAQYDWRFGPELMTCGPYRPVKLISYTARLSCVHARASVRPDLEPSLSVDLDIDGRLQAVHSIRVRLFDLQGNVLREHISAESPASDEADRSTLMHVPSVVTWGLKDVVQLWWPVDYGDQALYLVNVELLGLEGAVIDSHNQRIGFRRIELVQEPLAEADQYGKGSTFFFRINGVRVFAGGSNWIPADNFLTTISSARYRAWITLLRDGNQNMVRVWGGGIYEPDNFYDVCDELGILVWQDFQFACGVYPAHDDFVQSVKAEAQVNVKRLRRHPSLALFCGNNEDYQMVLQWGDVAELPARKIYEEVLPSVVTELTDPVNPIPYHRGSPYGGEGWDTADPTIGDIHQWNIWGGAEKPWQEYDHMGGRFVSEFGIPAMPCLRTVMAWARDTPEGEEKLHPQSKIMAQHCRAGQFERRFAILMNENFRLTEDLERYAYNTQLLQSEAVSFAYRTWRREWKGKGKEYCSGVLAWQLNDCWPVTSWAIADYFLRPKPAYYSISRELRKVTIGVFRTVHKNRPSDRPRQTYEFGAYQTAGATISVWATNAALSPVTAKVEITSRCLLSDWSHVEVQDGLTLGPNQSTEINSDLPCFGPKGTTDSHTVVVAARLLDSRSGEVLARYVDWPQPFKYLDLRIDPGLSIQVDLPPSGVDETKLHISSQKPVKCLFFSVDYPHQSITDHKAQSWEHAEHFSEEPKWSDNALDIMPGDEQLIKVKGLRGRVIRAAYLGHEKGFPIQ